MVQVCMCHMPRWKPTISCPAAHSACQWFGAATCRLPHTENLSTASHWCETPVTVQPAVVVTGWKTPRETNRRQCQLAMSHTQPSVHRTIHEISCDDLNPRPLHCHCLVVPHIFALPHDLHATTAPQLKADVRQAEKWPRKPSVPVRRRRRRRHWG